MNLLRASISRRLTLISVMVTALALVLATLAFSEYDRVSSRQALLASLSAQAQLVGENSAAALTFNDIAAATTTLSALRHSPGVVSAGIFDKDGKLFAEVKGANDDTMVRLPIVPPGQQQISRIAHGELVLVRNIDLDGKQIGAVYIRSDLQQLGRRSTRYMQIAIVVLLISLLIAFAAALLLQRSVSRPIVDLANTARQITAAHDYSRRASSPAATNEIAVLVGAFNEMLDEIQRRDAELTAARDELEERVRQRTDQLVRSNRELEAFSYTVSHDLRGPLDAMGGYSYLLLEDYGRKLDQQGAKALQTIRSEAKRMAELIDDLLNLSRVATTLIERRVVDLSGVVQSIAQRLRTEDPSRDIEFVIAEVPPVDADEKLLRIGLENLIRNAWKYTSKTAHARVEFGAEQRNGSTVYYVKDNGAGFDPRRTNELFKPFQRLHSASEFPGTGVGLATVQRIIDRHNGRIWAEGSPNGGAVFYFTVGAAEPSMVKSA